MPSSMPPFNKACPEPRQALGGRARVLLETLSRLLLLTFAFTTTTATAAPEIEEYVLDNGLTVVVRPDDRAPVVVFQVWYKVGSSYEHRGVTGISHVLEHMMFKRTEAYPTGAFTRIITEQGGDLNAFTSRDYTGYYEMLAADRLPIAMELEADRMTNLIIDEPELVKEAQVVMEERRLRVEDDPISAAMERFNYLAHPVSGYRLPVIGWWEDLRAMTKAELLDWYDRYYAPNNAVLVVAGDVEPEAVLALAKKYFGDIPAEDLPETGQPPIDVAEFGERRLELTGPVDVPFLAVGYQVPSLNTVEEPWEVYALEVLASILSGGDSALLPRELVRGREIATSLGAGYSMAARLDTLFMFTGYPAQDRGLPELETALGEVLAPLKAEPVSAEVLARAKKQLIADYLYQLDSIYYQAMQIGVLETTGIGWEALAAYEDGIEAVTAEQVQAVARKYLEPARRTVMHLNPEASGGNDQ